MDKIEARELVFGRVREIPFDISKELAERRLWGLHKSEMRGPGFDFMGHAPYEEGQERFVDWLAFGRTGEKRLKRFREEKEAPLLFVVDLSSSMFSGTKIFFDFLTLKCEAAFAVAASLHYSAEKTSDPVGYYLISPSGKSFLYDPGKGDDSRDGLDAAWNIIWEQQKTSRENSGKFVQALKRFAREYDRPSLIFIISDLSETFSDELFSDFKNVVKKLNHSHEIVAVVVRSPWEYRAPDSDATLIFAGDKKSFFLHLESPKERAIYEAIICENLRSLKTFFEATEIKYAFLETDDNIIGTFEQKLALMNE